MLSAATDRLAQTVTARWGWILTAWLLVTGLLLWAAPPWKSVALDGDFEYLPSHLSSVAAADVLDEAFAGDRARSQIVFVLGRQSGTLSDADLMVGADLLRRLYHRLAEASYRRGVELGYTGGPIEEAPEPARRWLNRTREALDLSIELDQRFYERFSELVPDAPVTLTEPRMAIAYYDRAKFLEQTRSESDAAGADLRDALVLVPDIDSRVVPITERPLEAWDTLLDVLSWDEPVIGSQLSKPGARLAVMQLSSELAATGNIETVEAVERLLQRVRRYSLRRALQAGVLDPGLRVEFTGSAAIGGETLIAARDAIRYTESITVVMILLILVLVYRAPLLVAVPMLSIGVAVLVSTSLIALLTDWSLRGVIPWPELRVFTTSRIFIVVILFGAGTDYCLFLISRLREEAGRAEWPAACRQALTGVTSALLGSALTTVFGLAMLWFAQFGKYHHTGPVIALCLLVGLVVCLTLAPALLRGLGPRVFWPNRVLPQRDVASVLAGGPTGSTPVHRRRASSLWGWIALKLTRRPVLAFVAGWLVLSVPGAYGWWREDSVTYDMTSQLEPDARTRRGFRLLSEHFKVGEINPVTILLVRPQDVPRERLKEELKGLSDLLYEQAGVVAVRTSNDPLGDFPPDREMGLLSGDAWRRRALQQHRVAQNYFFSEAPRFQNRLARLDVIIEGDPFSLPTAEFVTGVHRKLEQLASDSDSLWHGSDIYLSGTTPSIIDLRQVTIADNRRIKLAVVVAVFLVLLAVIRRLGLCLYLILTVLLSYYATLGLTVLFFGFVYGDAFVGLDWKLPLFLFVILVAVGQDYNVYLVTRIVEEQQQRGWLAALRHAVLRTGGIITACGLVMAATFFSMTASAWMPDLMRLVGIPTDASPGLRGIIELGFALGLGVLIDTFYVRTILVPSFVALVGRLKLKHRVL